MTCEANIIAVHLRALIVPVIHYADANQAMRNAERAAEAGCDGVLLIEMRGRNDGLLFAGAAIKRRWPALQVGINHLGTEAEQALHDSMGAGVDSTWTDDQLTHSGRPLAEADRVATILQARPDHQLFCGVAFKHQRPEPDPAGAAQRALERGFIPTTSGPATGMAADPAAVVALREAIGPDAPLAIASGITPDNAAAFLPAVTHVLVSTGVSASFHEFDPAALQALVAVAGQGRQYTGQHPTGYPPCDPCDATGVVPIMVPAISLWQPWASLIFTGDKLHETRAYPPPRKHLGQRVAIHAAQRLPTREQVSALLGIWCERTWGADEAWRTKLPRGVLLGTAVLVEAIRTDHRQPGPTDLVAGDWSTGRWAWQLGDVRALREPVPWKGKQGWFAVPEESIAEVCP